MIQKLLFSFLASIVMAVAVAGTVRAEGRLDRIKTTGEVALGFRDSSIPFSYLDDKQQPIGYSMDICRGVVDALKKQLGLPQLKTKLVPVTSSTRIPLVANGTVDLACGSATNNEARQKQVSFAPTMFVTATRFAALKKSNVKDLDDFKGKTVVSTAGTSNIRWLTQVNAEKNLGMRIIPAKDHAEAFLMVGSGRAVAFFMDDVLLAGLAASSRNPDEWMISANAYTLEPYGIIEPKNDPQFKEAVDNAVKAMMKDGTVEKLYNKWFMQAIPPKNINLNLPMSEELKRVFANPTDSPDPAAYK
ncbi:amino acid ABC transporter substrate-binding protein [Eoetvoesiella caeni]|uniref:Amino acid ABC transporter substrate-binding protein (PAAT family) n=1 Tax=Eoetvoesiella caeni TaxID=645616 RepID=A0A366H2T5_9BURK|nr:amino acid ABC transporter substrate-binding protein [Eoetvoesiella caeni]MCI2810619.1 amino acid ABC transporter substrate-binding protein [Eoetvoesiella caeni]NYT56597.1 amino acid ABC transporter substrate-binding protein [Eoetvoesiella caeni]RBP36242.1 amino acid ABC transporter substrate-binding protein (PAAT family) [Eoetvoesiella caeni]